MRKLLKLLPMLLLLLSVGIVYWVLVIALTIGWHKAVKLKLPKPANLLPVTVVVPFRNEATNLPVLIKHLKLQTYQLAEFILVNDASTDDGVAVLKKLITSDARFKIVQNIDEGKKQAIACGVKHANGEIILTTDADCTMAPEWIETMVSYFLTENQVMVLGPVVLKDGKSFFGKLQQTEFVSLIASAAAGVGLNRPFICNGANLAYRKSAFEAVGGFDGNAHVASGDDEFLMRAISQKYSDGILFASHEQARVFTDAMPNMRSFMAQRLRWAAKWRFNNAQTKVLAIGVILIHSVFLFCIINLLVGINNEWKPACALILGSRLITEFIFLKPVSKFLKLKWNWVAFLFWQVAYPLYAVLTGLFSNFISNSWRGRKI